MTAPAVQRTGLLLLLMIPLLFGGQEKQRAQKRAPEPRRVATAALSADQAASAHPPAQVCRSSRSTASF